MSALPALVPPAGPAPAGPGQPLGPQPRPPRQQREQQAQQQAQRPANLANRYASQAEDCAEREDWPRAIENYYLAAEQYLAALKDTTDAEAQQTLRLLHSNNLKRAKELQKRTAGAPSRAQPLPSPDAVAPRLPGSRGVTETSRVAATAPAPSSASSQSSAGSSAPSPAVAQAATAQPPPSPPQPQAPHPPQHGDETGTRFWDTLEHLVARLPALGTGALNFAHWAGGAAAWQPPDTGEVPEGGDPSVNASMLNSYYVVPRIDAAGGGPSAPVSANTSVLARPIGLKENGISDEPPVTNSALAQENAVLRQIIAGFEKNSAVLEDIARENVLLRSNIAQFRNDVHDHARRFRQQEQMRSSSAYVSPGSSNLQASMPSTLGMGERQELQMLRERVRALEAELRQMTAERAEMQTRLRAYDERWRDLTAAARQRRLAAASGAAAPMSTSTAETSQDRAPPAAPAGSTSLYHSVAQ